MEHVPNATTWRGLVTAWLPAYGTLVELTAQGPRMTAAPSPSSIVEEPEDFVVLDSGRALLLAASVGKAHQRQEIRRSAFTLEPGGTWRRMSEFPALPSGFSVIGTADNRLALWDRYYRRVLWVSQTQLK
jgi:hypothetical protein